MNSLLLRSLQVTHETTNTTLDEIAAQANMDLEELADHATKLNNPIDKWKKIMAPVPNIVDVLPPKDDKPEEEHDLKRQIDDTYKSIVNEAQAFLANNVDLEPKDLKDIASIIKLVEDAKYPKQSSMAGEIDLKNGVVRFLSQVQDDV